MKKECGVWDEMTQLLIIDLERAVVEHKNG